MASYTLAAGERGAYAKTLVAATVDTVTFTTDFDSVEVYNAGTGTIYFTVGLGSAPAAPTVGGAASYELPANAVRTVKAPQNAAPVVKLISAGTPTYSVSGE